MIGSRPGGRELGDEVVEGNTPSFMSVGEGRAVCPFRRRGGAGSRLRVFRNHVQRPPEGAKFHRVGGSVFWKDNFVGVYQGSTRLTSRVTESHLQSRGFGLTKRLR